MAGKEKAKFPFIALGTSHQLLGPLASYGGPQGRGTVSVCLTVC